MNTTSRRLCRDPLDVIHCLTNVPRSKVRPYEYLFNWVPDFPLNTFAFATVKYNLQVFVPFFPRLLFMSNLTKTKGNEKKMISNKNSLRTCACSSSRDLRKL